MPRIGRGRLFFLFFFYDRVMFIIDVLVASWCVVLFLYIVPDSNVF